MKRKVLQCGHKHSSLFSTWASPIACCVNNFAVSRLHFVRRMLFSCLFPHAAAAEALEHHLHGAQTNSATRSVEIATDEKEIFQATEKPTWLWPQLKFLRCLFWSFSLRWVVDEWSLKFRRKIGKIGKSCGIANRQKVIWSAWKLFYFYFISPRHEKKINV